ncbi:hypothetical protein M6D81_16305 [Paenibacillus sp. J5C_2022]|uniref:hypothetical protein n=1 Tax=Paenibacillus sp. J5C2022 TaxID=2977129 RepID=UPI0021CECF99|nr:hypothetical protein [Paenibacillus sp. J5C2022]MCU6710263.1 hypothetical protein [Paenibacillus sp. J5C2022]
MLLRSTAAQASQSADTDRDERTGLAVRETGAPRREVRLRKWSVDGQPSRARASFLSRIPSGKAGLFPRTG